MHIEQIDLSTWKSSLPSSGFEVFHTAEALEILDTHTTSELRLYAAHKGDQVVGLLPVFVERNPLGRAILSPPPSVGISRLGPIVMTNSPKQRKREQVNQQFIDLVLEELTVTSSRSLLRIECPLSYSDPRPFRWANLDVSIRFTYVLDLGDTTLEDVMAGFSRDLRKEIRSADDLDITVDLEGLETAMRIYDDVDARYGEHGDTFPLTRELYGDLVEAIEDRCRVYVARDGDGNYLGGVTVLYSNDHALFWQGGVAATYKGSSVNSVLHWRIIQDIMEDPALESVTGYDLFGANTPRLCKYKSKFGADLVPNYTVESTGMGMAMAKRAYQMVSK